MPETVIDPTHNLSLSVQCVLCWMHKFPSAQGHIRSQNVRSDTTELSISHVNSCTREMVLTFTKFVIVFFLIMHKKGGGVSLTKQFLSLYEEWYVEFFLSYRLYTVVYVTKIHLYSHVQ